MSLLNRASYKNKLEIVEYLISHKADIESKDHNGLTPLFIASMSDNVEVVKYLLDKGADPYNNSNDTILSFSCYFGKLACVKYLVEETKFVEELKTDKLCRPLARACKNGSLPVVKYLIEEQNVKFDTTDDDGNSQLHIAIYFSNNIETIDYLIDHCKLDKEQKNKKGETPLQYASSHKFDNSKHLIEVYGCDIHTKDNQNQTILHSAQTDGYKKVKLTKYLIEEKHMDVNAVDNDGQTVLHVACKSIHCEPDHIKYLIQNGADIRAKDKFDKTAYDYANNEKRKAFPQSYIDEVEGK